MCLQNSTNTKGWGKPICFGSYSSKGKQRLHMDHIPLGYLKRGANFLVCRYAITTICISLSSMGWSYTPKVKYQTTVRKPGSGTKRGWKLKDSSNTYSCYAKSFWVNTKYVYNSYRFSTSNWLRYLKSFFGEDNDPFTLHSLQYVCWWLDKTGRQSINSNGIDLIHLG